MLQPGDTFGDYRVLKLLGKGGMGSVFLLENAGGGQVAAKILDPATASDHEARKRFLREAQLALGVKHPNLVEAYDVGEDPKTGLCYILLEYVSGGSLADYLKRNGALPVEDAVVVVRAMASVLELAREKGIVHRDIKPANIMFAADGTPKLADLGIARKSVAEDLKTTTLTQTGAMIGTPAYMAPEQMLDAHNVDARADIYSLGVVFFEMLTGERPNKDDTAVQLMAKVVKGEPLPDVRTMRPEVSASLAQLLNMMVSPDKEGRISTPGQITGALDIIRRGGEFRDAVSELRLPVARGRRKRHFKIILAVFLPLLIVVAGSVVLVPRRQSIAVINSLRARYDRPPVSMDLDPYDVKRVAEKMVGSLLSDVELFRKTYGNQPLLVIGDIKNRTSFGIDTAWIADSLRKMLVRSRIFRLADNTTRTQTVPQLLLFGSLVEMDERIGGTVGRHFKLSLFLKDLKTGEYVWSDEGEVRKERK